MREVRQFLRRAAPFALIGLALYGALYAASERLIGRYAQRNRFFMVRTATQERYGHVILGASHAAVFDYQDMNAQLEQMTGTKILNLAIVGAGITVNRLLLEYFLARHETASVVYVVDSFTFYSPQWNEERFEDAQLFHRAPFDPVLARLLFQHPVARLVALDYLVGFSKINNPGRFQPDIAQDELTRFTRSYRPVPQIDRQRIEYLYPREMDERTQRVRDRYLAELDDLAARVQSRGIRFVAIKPPIPARIYRQLPGEADFDAALRNVLRRHGVELHDGSLVVEDERFFFDTDHLNRAGVLYFFENDLSGALTGP